MSSFAAELEFAVDTAVEAGEKVRQIYNARSAQTYVKVDESPVTDADLASDRIIRERIAATYPHDALLTEEGADDQERLNSERVWIADPIDGTQQFLDRTGQFDVLIALVVAGRPVVCVLLQPTTGFYLAATQGGGAIAGLAGDNQRAPAILALPPGAPNISTSIWLGAPASEPYLAKFTERLDLALPGVNVTGLIPRGHLDPGMPMLGDRSDRAEILGFPEPIHGFLGIPMRGDGTMAWEWDFVAADLVINEAGGKFTDWHGDYFTYNKPRPRNSGGLIVANSPGLHERMLEAIAPEIDAVAALREKA